MAIDSDIRDQVYQFFVQEAPELLQAIESGLLGLRQERSVTTVHNLMRAAHSLKGITASLELNALKTLAHRLEDLFKTLQHSEVEIDAELESGLLQAFDCFRLPLITQITTGQMDAEQAIAVADPIFAQVEQRLQAFLGAETLLPTMVDFGIDMTEAIFAADVPQALERLTAVLAQGQPQDLLAELRTQAEEFAGFAELLSLPGFGAIATTVLAALKTTPAQVETIAQLALTDFWAAHQQVMAGDRTQGGTVSPALQQLAAPDLLLQPGATATAPVLETLPLQAAAPEIADLLWAPTPESDLNQPASLPFPDLVELLNLGHAEVGAPEAEATPTELEPAVPASCHPDLAPPQELPQSLVELMQNLEQFLPPQIAATPEAPPALLPVPETVPSLERLAQPGLEPTATAAIAAPEVNRQQTVRVDVDRLERMNNVVGELAISRNGLSLQNEQLQTRLQTLLDRFARLQKLTFQLQTSSGALLTSPAPATPLALLGQPSASSLELAPSSPSDQTEFDTLELDHYGQPYSLLQAVLEETAQLHETVEDMVLLGRQSSQTLESQRQFLHHLRQDLMWARMLPLSEILNRFPRILRDLTATYHKPATLKLSGTGVLVDKAVLEKLFDPLLHLLRNAFDHGLEPPEVRQQQGKPAVGVIEIRAYHRGSQTVIEVQDDGQGIDLERLRQHAAAVARLSETQLSEVPPAQLLNLLFEPGFSTATEVSELSGRGMGLDIVRSQLQALKGTVTVTTAVGQGTTLTLQIPLTLTIAQLLLFQAGPSAFALAADSIEAILVPQAHQLKTSSGQRFLHWQGRLMPITPLAQMLDYGCPLSEVAPSLAIAPVPIPEDWAKPLLLLRQGRQLLALEVDRLLGEQELVIKPFGSAIAPPNYLYGCTILGDGSPVPVLDPGLLCKLCQEALDRPTPPAAAHEPLPPAVAAPVVAVVPTLLVVDDSITLRQSLALTLQKAGYRVLQARDGREALEQLLQQGEVIQLVVCDLEMPNMNGFEFLNQRRQQPQLAQIPVVILTSRSNEKHRRLALHLGANHYFTKPYLEAEFLAAIAHLLPSVPHP